MLFCGEDGHCFPVLHPSFGIPIPGLLTTHSCSSLRHKLDTPFRGLSMAGELGRIIRFDKEPFDLFLGQWASENWLIHLPWLPSDKLGQFCCRQVQLWSYPGPVRYPQNHKQLENGAQAWVQVPAPGPPSNIWSCHLWPNSSRWELHRIFNEPSSAKRLNLSPTWHWTEIILLSAYQIALE